MTTLINLVNTFHAFYLHNWQLVYFGGFAAFSFLKLIVRPSRYYAFLLLGFLLLLFEFEYSKHLISHVRENVTELVIENPERRSFTFTDAFFSQLLPVGMQALGWFGVLVSTFFLPKDERL